MNLHQTIKCPNCSGTNFVAKFESTYVYSYKIDSPESNTANDPVPFLFDDRKQTDSKQYIVCSDCNAKYPCEFTMDSEHVDFTILKKAIRANYTKDIEFWG